jgi:LysR family transcriptional regulator, transcriptional activator of the cysJI operon
MELKYIEAFLMVVEKGSFSTAAEALFISQPTISVRIQLLEQDLKTELFSRASGKRITLTPAGQKILPYFKEAYEIIKQGYSALNEETEEPQKISFACPNHMGSEIMPDLLNVLYQHFPDVEFQVTIKVSKDIIEDIRTGAADMGFAFIKSPGSVKDLSVVEISKESTVLVCSPDHPLSNLETLHLSDLKNERIITYSKTFFNTKTIDNFLKKHGFMDYKTTEINNLGWVKMMVRKGLGVAFLQKMIVNEELKNGTLLKLPLQKSVPPTSIFLLFRHGISEDMKQVVTETAKNLFEQITLE